MPMMTPDGGSGHQEPHDPAEVQLTEAAPDQDRQGDEVAAAPDSEGNGVEPEQLDRRAGWRRRKQQLEHGWAQRRQQQADRHQQGGGPSIRQPAEREPADDAEADGQPVEEGGLLGRESDLLDGKRNEVEVQTPRLP